MRGGEISCTGEGVGLRSEYEFRRQGEIKLGKGSW